MNQAVDARHYTAAALYKLNAVTTDIRQELTDKYLYLNGQESIFFFMVKKVTFIQSFWIFFQAQINFSLTVYYIIYFEIMF